jgi:hypothetical protein
MHNVFFTACDRVEDAHLLLAQADAAMIQQAYWVARYHEVQRVGLALPCPRLGPLGPARPTMQEEA